MNYWINVGKDSVNSCVARIMARIGTTVMEQVVVVNHGPVKLLNINYINVIA